MSQVLDGIRADLGAENCCNSCSRDGCRAFLEDIPPERIIVDADKAFEAHGQSGKRCDFILFVVLEGCRKLVVAPIELKSGKLDVSDAVQQLQEGSTFAEKFITQESEVACRPILLYGRGIHPKEHRLLNRAKIRFCGMKLTVKTRRCGKPRNIADALGI